MQIVYQILIGLALFGAGLVFAIFPRKMVYITGEFPWTNKYLGAGGTFVFYMLLGIGMIILGFLFIFGFMGFLFK